MAAQKSRGGVQPIGEFLDTLDADRRADTDQLIAMMRRVTGHAPVVWTGGIIGFGDIHYRYGSGHEGDRFEIGFAPRAREFVLYCDGLFGPPRTRLLTRLGPHRSGVGCVYIKRLADIDRAALDEMIDASVAGIRAIAIARRAERKSTKGPRTK
ncbi:MAG TPA: DUF1801 domain-containing protein [Gemmatimonadales bacterium]|jgi:hypothetical protein